MKNLNYNLLLKIPLLKIPHYKKQIEKINKSQNKNINLIKCFDDEIYLNYEKYLKSIQNNNNNNNDNKINIPLLKTEKITKKKRIYSPIEKNNNNINNINFSNNSNNNNNYNNNNSTITTTAFYSSERGNKHKKIINDLLSLSYNKIKKQNDFYKNYNNKNDVYINYKTLEHNLNNKNKKKRIFSYDFLNNNNNKNFLSKSQLFSHSIEYKNNINEICKKIDKNCLKTKKIFQKHKKHYRILSEEDFKRIELKKELEIKGKIKKNNPFKNAQLFKESDVIFNLNDDFVFKNNKIIKNIMNKTKKFEKNNNKNNIEKMMFKTKYLIRINKEIKENIKNRTNKFFENIKKNL